MNRNNFWCVLYTQSKYEKKIKKELDERGITNYLPTYNTVRQWSDRKKKLNLPLFPNYIFVNRNLLNLYEVFDIKGVMKYLKDDHQVHQISEQTIEILKDSSKANVQPDTTLVKHGSPIRLNVGSSDIAGVIKGNRRDNKVAVFLPELNKTILVDGNLVRKAAS